MPIYEYQCAKCGAVEEALQTFSDKPLNKCGRCSGKLHKLISQSSFHLKGTGWYVTDYSKKAKSKQDSSVAKSDHTENSSSPSAQSDSQTSKTDTD